MISDIDRVYGDIVKSCSLGRSYLTKFLSLDEISKIKGLEKDFEISYFGGYSNAERVKAFVNKKNARESEFGIIVLKIESDEYLEITHRNVLGTLMSLGVKRNVIGDIIVKDSHTAYILIDYDMVDYILREFNEINHHKLKIEKVSYSQLEELNNKNVLLKDIIVPSLRLDAIVSTAFNVSRNKVSDDIIHGLVFINNKEILKADQKVLENSIISYRKYGRIKVLNQVHITKKNNIVLNIEIYK